MTATITVTYTVKYVSQGAWGKLAVTAPTGEVLGHVVGFAKRANVLEAYADPVVNQLAIALNGAFIGLDALRCCRLSTDFKVAAAA